MAPLRPREAEFTKFNARQLEEISLTPHLANLL